MRFLLFLRGSNFKLKILFSAAKALKTEQYRAF